MSRFMRGPSFCGTGGAFIGRRMAYSPCVDKSNPADARPARSVSRKLPDPAETSVDCGAKSILRCEVNEEIAVLAKYNALRSLAAEPPPAGGRFRDHASPPRRSAT